MRLQPWAEGPARVNMAAAHRFLGRSSASDREGNGSGKVWSFYQKMVTIFVFIKDIQIVQRLPYNSSLL